MTLNTIGLVALKEEKKFSENSLNLYPGAVSEEERLELENKINTLIDKILTMKEYHSKQTILDAFSLMLNECDKYDTEDKEHICFYLEKIMDLCFCKWR